MEIRVGIKTDGEPIIKKRKDFFLVDNMLIGDGFHWQKSIKAKLPGEITAYNNGSGISEADKRITLINKLPLETYLECVVGSEMNPEAPIEFLKAHAVISRSWAIGKIRNIHQRGEEGAVHTDTVLIGWDDTSGHYGFHVCSDDHCQRYQGLQTISERALKAIHETENKVLVSSNGEIIDSRFSKCCGGRTEMFETCWQNLNPASLVSFDDPWCDLNGLSSHARRALLSSVLKNYDLDTQGYGYSWSAEITKKDVEENLLNKFNRNIGKIEKLEPLHRGRSGRIDLLRIHGSAAHLDLGKELWIRRLLSSSHLYSSAFDIEDEGDRFKLLGKGWGHGVGLCQIGAANMAVNGKSYQEILSFYYPGSYLFDNPFG